MNNDRRFSKNVKSGDKSSAIGRYNHTTHSHFQTSGTVLLMLHLVSLNHRYRQSSGCRTRSLGQLRRTRRPRGCRARFSSSQRSSVCPPGLTPGHNTHPPPPPLELAPGYAPLPMERTPSNLSCLETTPGHAPSYTGADHRSATSRSHTHTRSFRG